MQAESKRQNVVISSGQISPDSYRDGSEGESVPKRMRRKGKRGNFFTSFRDKNHKDPKTGYGKQIEVSLGTNDEIIAQRKLGELDARRADGGGDPTLLNKKFSVIAGQFLKQIVPTYSPTTQRSTKSRIKADLIPFFGNVRIADIGERLVIDYKFMREGRGRNGASIEGELSNLKSIMNLVRPAWRLPARKRLEMRYLNVTDPVDVYFNSEEEFQQILGFCPEDIKAMVVVARKTGLRRANITGMKWAWVNVVRGIITIPSSAHKNKKPHVVKMNKTVHALFKKMRIEGDIVFPPTGKYKNLAWGTWLDYVCDSFKKACRSGGRPDFTFHGLRHDFCSQLVMRGIPLYTVSKMAGHSSIKITERYAHLAQDIITEAIHVLDEPVVAIVSEQKMESID